MATLKQLIECEISDFFAGFGHPGEPETPEEMQSQLLARVMPLLAGLEREPVAQVYQPANIGICAPLGPSVMMLKPLNPGTKLYAAPQLPQPAAVDEWRMMCGEWRDETVSIHDASGLIVSGISPNAAGIIIEAHNAFRAAMLQGAEPVSQPCTLPADVIDALEKALQAMSFMGDTLNALDAVCEEDVEYVTPAFEAVREVLEGAEPVPGWIPCSERMPEEIGRYWCYVEEQNSLGKSHYQWNCSWNGDRWWVESENGGRVTHWMPLQAAPQQEVKSGR